MNKKGLSDFLEAYNFIEDISGKNIVNIIKTTEIIRHVYDELFSKYGISEPKFRVLLILSIEEDGMALCDIGKRMLVTRANMTGLVDRMVKEGLVEKKVNPEDKRSIKAYLTPKGIDLFESVKDKHIEFSEKMTRSLSEEEKKQLSHLLQKLQRGIVDSFE
ncbi:MarR family transcriptional regulator, 2-MHQ and catechol-resistance regulon repressor [Peptoclostridium litorale DSM 5388]|uniref:Putative multiple antibiotic resistance protein MarR n=1 Tax=Peptoclostridium litorale DSM 5388 TaxID=1121324 RepID=A0A069RCN9_PEPLI|nr:MarR family transcriptional regulator [Peptoclostridium litorale]KDR94791.1 putative multiple antibiotic resistance protein MarR [Peptoclostridium litorale DSM 5388]SIN92764.1 MarR family transcriptional regulator, 2-MHQ and catechol-resistance regulon repressor [Peptoclostridium litorale DSM 5388]